MVFYFGYSAPAPLVSTTILFHIPRSCSFLSFFPRSFHRAASMATFYAFWSSPVACVLRLPFLSSGFPWAFWHFPLSFCLVLPKFLPSFALLLGLQSLSRSFHILVMCWWFFGSSGSHQPVSFSPLRVPSLFPCGFCLDRIFGSLRNMVSLRVESGFAPPYVLLSSRNSFWCSFSFQCGLVVFL